MPENLLKSPGKGVTKKGKESRSGFFGGKKTGAGGEKKISRAWT